MSRPAPPTDPRFVEGLALLRAREWYAAHEALEDVWRASPAGELRECLQGIIQVCVALEHLRRGNVVGWRNVFDRARQRLEPLPPVVAGMQTRAWIAALNVCFDHLDLAAPGPPPVLPPVDTWPVLPLDEPSAR